MSRLKFQFYLRFPGNDSSENCEIEEVISLCYGREKWALLTLHSVILILPFSLKIPVQQHQTTSNRNNWIITSPNNKCSIFFLSLQYLKLRSLTLLFASRLSLAVFLASNETKNDMPGRHPRWARIPTPTNKPHNHLSTIILICEWVNRGFEKIL